ncbi:hypothetical protein WR25_22907 [Diploscapter pachys]|uniref:Inositol 1,4,5-trisphosphate receptor n=1 Tax=Diploscapter pachys TaxID=2018661 RepID=A0A2A2L384_9BILA|nr:hypothetical protein WR25_22907 [Diploscapter pachys]
MGMSMEGGNTALLHIGDIISLYSEESQDHRGFLSTLGLVDDRCIIELRDGRPESPPKKFRDCLFKICPKQLWTEQKRFQSGESTFDAEMMNKLRIAADKENEQNELEFRKTLGSVVQYGTTVQLLHVKSDKYITVQKNSPAKCERNAMKVAAGNKISLIPYSVTSSQPTPAGHSKHQLHISHFKLPDHPNSVEVNCLNELTEWQVFMFLLYNENQEDILKSGDVVRLFHADQQTFLTLDAIPKSIPLQDVVFLRMTNRPSAADATSSRALWEVQVVQKDAYRGGSAKWRETFRFKHLATDMYLTVQKANQLAKPATNGRRASLLHTKTKDSYLQPPTNYYGENMEGHDEHIDAGYYFLVPIKSDFPESDKSLLFSLDPSIITKNNKEVAARSFVRLQHEATGYWVHATNATEKANLYYSSKNEKGWVRVILENNRIDKETFALLPVSPNEVRDLDFTNDACKALKDFIRLIRIGSVISKELINVTIQLLTECIYFVTNTTNHMINPLKVSDFSPSRGEANKKIQELICNSVLSERHRDIFMDTKLIDGEVYIGWGQENLRKLVNVSEAAAIHNEDARFLDYYRHQLDLLAQMCQEQQYLAIDPPPERKLMNISHQLPADLVLKCMSDSRLPYEVRASFTRLLLHLHIVRGSPLSAIRHARLWWDIPMNVNIHTYESTSVEGYSDGSRVRIGERISQKVLSTVDEYLISLRDQNEGPVLKSDAQSVNMNKLTYEIVTLSKALAQFGFYSFDKLLQLAQNLLAIVDDQPNDKRRTRKVTHGMNLIAHSMNRVTTTMLTTGNANRNRNTADKEVNGIEESVRSKESRQLRVKAKLTVAEILQFVMDVRRDYRITMALSWFKTNFPCDVDGSLVHSARINEAMTAQLYDAIYQSAGHELHLDGKEGQQLLAILLQMTMSDYPPLTSIALKVLFRHFTQYQALLEDLKQVQLLVSQDDVENYRQVDRDLFILKNLTEKSELWVHGDKRQSIDQREDREDRITRKDLEEHNLVTTKAFSSEDLMKAVIEIINEHYPNTKDECLRLLNRLLIKEDRNDAALALQELSDKAPLIAYPLIRQILVRIKRLCYREDKPDQMNQQLLRNMRVYEVVLEFISVPYDKKNDSEMPKLITLSHEFLRSFCKGNKENQGRLYKYISIEKDAKEGMLRVETVEEVATLVSIFRNNRTLSSNVSEDLIAHIVNLIEHKARNAIFLELLQSLVCVFDKEIETCQEKVAQEICSASDEVRQLYVDNASFEQLEQMMASAPPYLDSTHPLKYHVELVRLLSLCTRGKNGSTELKCASEIPMEHIVRVVTSPKCLIEVKTAYLQFLLHCYIDTDAEMKDAYKPEYVDAILHNMLQDVNKLKEAARPNANYVELEQYICHTVTEILMKFFERPYAEAAKVDIHQHSKLFSSLLQSLNTLEKTRLKTTKAGRSSRNWYRVAECVKRLSKWEMLFPQESKLRDQCAKGGVVTKLIQHCKTLMHNKQDNLCTRVLQTLRKMCNCSKQNFTELGEQLRLKLIRRYFDLHERPPFERQQSKIEEVVEGIKGGNKAGKEYEAAVKLTERNLYEIQCKLNEAGASDLVIDIIINEPSSEIFYKAICLAKALLHEGNDKVQQSFYQRLKKKDTHEPFFKAISLRIQTAQNRLKSDMMQCNDNKPKTSSTVLTPLVMEQGLDSPFTGPIFDGSLPVRHPSISELSNTSNDIAPSVPDLTPYQDEDRPTEALPPEVQIVEPILRVLQLLCENHNSLLQNFIRKQSDRTNHNLVAETLSFLDTVCGSTKGSLGVFAEISEHNFSLITQTLATLTEFCQGPCHENQNTMAMQENGLNIIISLVLNEIKPLADEHMELALEIKSNASKLLLAIMESRHDSENAERVLANMGNMAGGPKQLVQAITQAYEMANSKQYEINVMRKELLRQSTLQERPTNIISPPIKTQSMTLPEISVDASGTVSIHDSHEQDKTPLSDDKYIIVSDDEPAVDPREVGHNIYILAHQLARHSAELAMWLDGDDEKKDNKTREALTFYKKHTATIEIVRRDRTLERVVFPIHEICSYLTKETKFSVYNETERDNQGSKVTEFFEKWPDLYEEMKWQRKLQGDLSATNPFIYTPLIASTLFLYSQWDEKSSLAKTSNIITAFGAVLLCTAVVLIAIIGPVPTLYIYGFLQFVNKSVHVTSYIANKGLSEKKSWVERFSDKELLYHLLYLLFCLLGLVVHPMIYSLLLFDIVASEDTLRNVISSVTRNWQSIILTGLLALILVYIFSIIGFHFFQHDFVLEVDPLEETVVIAQDPELLSTGKLPDVCQKDDCKSMESEPVPPNQESSGKSPTNSGGDDADNKVRSCTTLSMCIIHTLNWGLRNGGGIGDVLRNVSPDEPYFHYRIIYDLAFYIVLIVIVLNLIFGVIIDTFGDLRTEKNEKEDILKNTCFVCGLERGKFDNRSVTFEDHQEIEHNLWHYLYFIVWLQIKDETEFTGPESYVAQCIKDRNLDWFPRMQAISLQDGDNDAEQPEIASMKELLRQTHEMMLNMTREWEEMKQYIELLRG